MHRQLLQREHETPGKPFYVAYMFATLDDEALDNGNGWRQPAIQIIDSRTAHKIIIKTRYLSDVAHHLFRYDQGQTATHFCRKWKTYCSVSYTLINLFYIITPPEGPAMYNTTVLPFIPKLIVSVTDTPATMKTNFAIIGNSVVAEVRWTEKKNK